MAQKSPRHPAQMLSHVGKTRFTTLTLEMTPFKKKKKRAEHLRTNVMKSILMQTKHRNVKLMSSMLIGCIAVSIHSDKQWLSGLSLQFFFFLPPSQAAVQDRLNEQEGVPSVFNPPPARPLQVNTGDHRVYSYIVSRPQPRVSASLYPCSSHHSENVLFLFFIKCLTISFFFFFFKGLLGWSYYLIMLPFRFTYYTLMDIFR